jgi:hypothetical protein
MHIIILHTVLRPSEEISWLFSHDDNHMMVRRKQDICSVGWSSNIIII